MAVKKLGDVLVGGMDQLVDLDGGDGWGGLLRDPQAFLYIVDVAGGGEAVALVLTAEGNCFDNAGDCRRVVIAEVFGIGEGQFDRGQRAVELFGNFLAVGPGLVGGPDLAVE